MQDRQRNTTGSATQHAQHRAHSIACKTGVTTPCEEQATLHSMKDMEHSTAPEAKSAAQHERQEGMDLPAEPDTAKLASPKRLNLGQVI